MFRHNNRHEFAAFFEHANLADRGLLGIGRFNSFRLNLLSALGFDQRRDATEDVKVIVLIKVTHVAGAKPSVAREDLFRFVREVPIACKNIRPPRENLANFAPVDALPFFERARIDPNLHAGKWFSYAVSWRFPTQVQREKRRSFGETVADGDFPA